MQISDTYICRICRRIRSSRVVGAVVATVPVSISTSSNKVKSEGRHLKQCWILYIKIKKNPKNPPLKIWKGIGVLNAHTNIINKLTFSFSLTLHKKISRFFLSFLEEVSLAQSQLLFAQDLVLPFYQIRSQNHYFVSFDNFFSSQNWDKGIFIWTTVRPLLTCRERWLIDGAVTAIWLLHCFHSSTQLKNGKSYFSTSFWDCATGDLHKTVLDPKA